MIHFNIKILLIFNVKVEESKNMENKLKLWRQKNRRKEELDNEGKTRRASIVFSVAMTFFTELGK